ncbi:MAG TPA: hypothetical protein VH165_37260 [Kofleriaceae bacterium]|jgi:hypothetical protein|nr:hypothetical protein [Kofleriaceae bacterium]
MVTRRLLVLTLGVGLGGCTLITDSFVSNDFSGDAFPVNVDTTSGAILVGMHPYGDAIEPAVLDVLSPLTIVDPGPGVVPSVSFANITMLGGSPSDPTDQVPRARFPGAQLIAIHPCDASDSNADGACHVGPAGSTEFHGILGADVLAGDDIRLRLAADQLFVLPDVGGSDRGRSLDCDAVFGSPYRGGGTLVIAGTELPFGNRRIAIQACLSPNPDAALQSQRGMDALFVASTGLGISILGQSAYQRYLGIHPGAPGLDTLPADTVYLPSGIVHGQRATIDSLALVGASGANELSPCRQIYAHRVLAPRSLGSSCDTRTNADCPCEDDSTFCTVPAILELTPPGGFDVLVIADSDPTLQALRAELRPDQPEIDGILGTGVLRAAEFDVDYPHDRLLARCPGGDCCVRPEFTQESDRDQINNCLRLQGCATCELHNIKDPLPCPATPPE